MSEFDPEAPIDDNSGNPDFSHMGQVGDPTDPGGTGDASGLGAFLQRLFSGTGGGSGGAGGVSGSPAGGLGTAALISALMGSMLGGNLGGSTTTTKTVQGMTPEERALVALNTQLSQAQLNNINTMTPLQQRQLQLSIDQMTQQGAQNAATNAAISPTDIANQQRAAFDASGRQINLGNQAAGVQSGILASGGAATPEQLARIQAAADAAIAAGTGDINTQLQRGINMVYDQGANARGLRMTDTPMQNEAALLARAAGDQTSSLVNSVRANQATNALNYPLAVNQSNSTIASGQQGTAQAAQQFQASLQQQATQNRLALTGQAGQTGIGLAGIGGSPAALSSLATARMGNSTQVADSSGGVTGLGQLLNIGRGGATGLGGLITNGS